MRRAKRRLRMLGAFGWFATGMVLWIAGSLAFQAWQWERAHSRPAPQLPPPPQPVASVDSPSLYTAAAERVFESYARSTEPSLAAFDWQKAEVCLLRAVELGANDDATLAKLALSRGYATLERLTGARYSEAAAAHLRGYARDQFVSAALKMPADPSPHLALARFYLYNGADPKQALAELDAAERLGAVLGQREVEQRAEAIQLRDKKAALPPPRKVPKASKAPPKKAKSRRSWLWP
jgi:hypothetical protein